MRSEHNFVVIIINRPRRRQLLAGRGRSVAPRWPRLTARLRRSAGGRLFTSHHIRLTAESDIRSNAHNAKYGPKS